MIPVSPSQKVDSRDDLLPVETVLTTDPMEKWTGDRERGLRTRYHPESFPSTLLICSLITIYIPNSNDLT